MKPIYLDYNATTAIDPRIASEMWPFITEHFGNPSSTHSFGSSAKMAMEQARSRVAALLGCQPAEIVFTSGGSESNNLALKGVAFALRKKGNHIVSCQVEHPSILTPLRFLEDHGFQVTILPVDRFGMVSPEDVRKALTPQTILVSIMHANNEVGTVQPVAAIGRITREKGILLHSDAAQSVGKIPVRIQDLNVDLLTVAGHKLYAPKGVGALFIRDGVHIEPLIHGSNHEAGRRAGTENVAFDVALGAACEQASREIESRASYLIRLRDRLHDGLHKIFGDSLHLNGHPTERLPNTLNVSFEGRTGAELLESIPEVAASTGSACRCAGLESSPVLRAMGIAEKLACGAVRFSLGKWTTLGEIDRVLELLKKRL
jgi:cysteine desulfurase